MGGTENMQDIGPDMDDLLRRAAEGYPLKAPADNWDNIASRLTAAQPATAITEKPKNKKRFLWLLLLLIPISIAFYFSLQHTNAGDNKMQNITHNNTKDEINIAKNNISTASKQHTPISTNNAAMEAQASNQQAGEGNNTSNEHNANSFKNAVALPSNKPIAFYEKSNVANDNSTTFQNGNPLVLQTNDNGLNYQDFNSFNSLSLNGVQQVNKNSALNNANTLPVATDIHLNETASALSGLSSTSKYRISNKKVYYGVLAGFGFSSVNHYGLKKAGYDAGLFAGYRFTKNISVEAGVLATQKYYMSRGDDFNSNNLDGMMQPGMKMMEVEGSSQGISIPLHVKLDLNTKNRNKVFAKTGVSSLLMTKERNFYHTMMNGNPEMLKGVYKDNKNYFAASFDVAAGYEQNIKGKFYLRLEPYIQIPIKHVGVGDLPVTSAGLHVGISWPVH